MSAQVEASQGVFLGVYGATEWQFGAQEIVSICQSLFWMSPTPGNYLTLSLPDIISPSLEDFTCASATVPSALCHQVKELCMDLFTSLHSELLERVSYWELQGSFLLRWPGLLWLHGVFVQRPVAASGISGKCVPSVNVHRTPRHLVRGALNWIVVQRVGTPQLFSLLFLCSHELE